MDTVSDHSSRLAALAIVGSDDGRVAAPSPAWGRLIYARSGALRVRIEDRLWIVPPARAIWVAPRTPHEIEPHRASAVHAVCLSPRLSAAVGAECRALDVSPLLRELILSVVGAGTLDRARARQRRLATLLVDELRDASALALSLRLPTDRRARVVAERLERKPADAANLAELSRKTGASARTLQRLFRAETGMRFVEWRQRMRMLHAVAMLGTGSSVGAAARQAGYETASAFSAAFRKLLGGTPTRYRHKNFS